METKEKNLTLKINSLKDLNLKFLNEFFESNHVYETGYKILYLTNSYSYGELNIEVNDIVPYAEPKKPAEPLKPKNLDVDAVKKYSEELIEYANLIKEYSEKKELYDKYKKGISNINHTLRDIAYEFANDHYDVYDYVPETYVKKFISYLQSESDYNPYEYYLKMESAIDIFK